MQHAHRLRRDQRRLLSGFRQHRVAGCERRRDLADKDGEREVPRADAHHRPQRSASFGAERAHNFLAVVAEEIDCLAHLRNSIGEGFAGFAADQAHQYGHTLFHRIGGAPETGGPVLRRASSPGISAASSCGECVVDVVRLCRRAPAPRCRRWSEGLRTGCAMRRLAPRRGYGRPANRRTLDEPSAEQRQLIFIAQVEARPSLAASSIEMTRQRDLSCDESEGFDGSRHRHRVGNQLVDGYRSSAMRLTKERISAVLQQTPHQIGEQCLMRPNGRIDSAGPVKLRRRRRLPRRAARPFRAGTGIRIGPRDN